MADKVKSRWAGKAVWFVPVGIVVCCVVLSAIQASKPQIEPTKAEVPPQNVGVMTLNPELHEEVIYLPGKVVADIDVTVSSELAGTLQRWLLEEGANVTEGQVIAQLDTAILDAKLIELTAALESAKAGLKAAEKGQELARLGQDTARQQQASAANLVKGAESNKAFARQELDRTKHLQTGKVSSQAELERDENAFVQAQVGAANSKENLKMAGVGVSQAEVQFEQAKANVAVNRARILELKAAIKSVQVSLDKSQIKAPLTGVIDNFLIEAGETVSPGVPLVKAYKLDFIRVLCHISDRYAPFLEQANPVINAYIQKNMPGAVQKVACSLVVPGMPKLGGGRAAGAEIPAVLARAAKAANSMSNTFEVEMRLPNPGGALKQGMIVQGKIKFMEYPQALVVPMSAIRVTDQGPKCLVAVTGEKGMVASVRTIEPRSVDKDKIMVSGDLTAGELLVVSGGKGILNGERVKIVQQDGQFLAVEKAKGDVEKLGKK